MFADAVVIGVTWKRTWTTYAEARINLNGPTLTATLRTDGTFSISLTPRRIGFLSMLD